MSSSKLGLFPKWQLFYHDLHKGSKKLFWRNWKQYNEVIENGQNCQSFMEIDPFVFFICRN